MSPLLYVGVVAYILKVRPLKFLPVFSIFNPKWSIPLELCHFLNRLSFQESFSPELCFIRCSKDVSSKNTVKECSMGYNVGFSQNKLHLLSRSCTFTPFSEASLDIQALFYSVNLDQNVCDKFHWRFSVFYEKSTQHVNLNWFHNIILSLVLLVGSFHNYIFSRCLEIISRRFCYS